MKSDNDAAAWLLVKPAFQLILKGFGTRLLTMRALCFGLFLLVSAALLNAEPSRDLRAWSNLEGEVILATLISSDGATVVLRQNDGRVSRISLEKLSLADRDYVSDLESRGLSGEFTAMPETTAIVPNVPVTGKGMVFETKHYRFETDRPASQSFIAQASRVFEGTVNAVASLPFGIEPKPPEGDDKFRARFVGREAFAKVLSENGGDEVGTPNSEIGGVYLPKRGEIVVPYHSIGAINFGSQVTVDKKLDQSTLIHEISHQLLHDWLPILPTWFSEGFSEYMAAVPYADGRFEFRYVQSGISARLHSKYESATDAVRLPSGLVGDDARSWKGTVREYRDAMLTFYYLLHRPGEAAGEKLTGYLNLLEKTRTDTLGFIGNYNGAIEDYEKRRLAFNKEVEAYNKELDALQKEIAAYDEKVVAYNTAIKAGVSPRLLKVPKKPNLETPKPPVRPEVPTILEENEPTDQPLDIFADANASGRGLLLGEQSAEEFSRSMSDFLKQSDLPVNGVRP